MSRSGLDDAAEDMDLSGFEPKAKPARSPSRPARTSTHAVSSAPSPRLVRLGEGSTDRAPDAQQRPSRAPRTYRSGRSETVAVKTTPDAASKFYGLADRLGLKVGETFERAVEALAREAGS